MKRTIISAIASGLIILTLLTSTTGITLAGTDDPKQAPRGTAPGAPGTPGAQVKSKQLPQSPAPGRPEDAVGTAFTYQGSLKDGANPASGQYDLQFTLFDAATGGNQVGSPVTVSNQTVSEGLFTVQLDFGASSFEGSNRWLEIAVRPAGGGTFTTLSPRQPLTAEPYAMSLEPGAVITGTVSGQGAVVQVNANGDGNGIYAQSAGGNSESAVYGEATGPDGNGVFGMANNGTQAKGVGGLSNTGTGVYGISAGTNQGGVVGSDSSGFGLIGLGFTGVSGAGTQGDGVRGQTDWGFGGNFSSNHSYGVYAQSNNEAAGVFSSTTSYGVVGRTVSAPGGLFSSTTSYGVVGRTVSAPGGLFSSTSNSGVVGVSNGGFGGSFSSNTNYGVYAASSSGLGGYFTSNTGGAIAGQSNGAYTAYFYNPNGNGVIAQSDHSDGIVGGAAYTDTAGLYGSNSAGYGVWGTGRVGVYGSGSTGDGVTGHSSSGTGVAGISDGGNSGVYGTSAQGYGVYGVAQATNGGGTVGEDPSGFGVIGNGYTGVSGTGTQGDGVRGQTDLGFGGNFSSNQSYGVYAQSNNEAAGVFSSTTSYGVFARTVSAPAGVFSSTSDYGVKGQSYSGLGVVGVSTVSSGGVFQGAGTSLVGEDPTQHCSNCYAGYFGYDVNVNGTLYANAKSFKIDDPLDPANKYLIHTSVESPDMLDIYRGHVTLDAQGSAWVQMPDYFQALNMDFDYQLTPIGKAQPNLYVAQEIKDNKFQISGGAPSAKVSWQVTGVRHDPYAEANRTPVEQAKSPQEQGLYLHPELYNQPASKGVNSVYVHKDALQTPPTQPDSKGGK
jgi:hypothetical protein